MVNSPGHKGHARDEVKISPQQDVDVVGHDNGVQLGCYIEYLFDALFGWVLDMAIA